MTADQVAGRLDRSVIQNEQQHLPIQGVIFDMDGVLIDSEPIYFEIERSSFDHFGAAVTVEEHHSLSVSRLNPCGNKSSTSIRFRCRWKRFLHIISSMSWKRC